MCPSPGWHNTNPYSPSLEGDLALDALYAREGIPIPPHLGDPLHDVIA